MNRTCGNVHKHRASTWIKKIEASGGSVKVVYSVADVILWLNEEVEYKVNT